jgi:hypothetical protein
MNHLADTLRRRLLIETLAGAATLSLLSHASAATPASAKAQASATDASLNPATSGITAASGLELPTGDIHDFDFFIGDWSFTNRRLKKRWVGSNDWETFPASLRCESRMNGVVNIDEGVFPTKGWSGMTLRVFHVEKRQWSLYWINSSRGEMATPVVGGFTGDRGVFYGDDTDEGRPIVCRFLWTRLGPNAARWEQAFSRDGKEWETNWIIEHARAKG